MSRYVHTAHYLVLFGPAGCVVHVPKMVLAFHIVLMVLDKLVLVRKFKEDGEEAEEFFYYFCVAFLIHLSTSIDFFRNCYSYPAKSLNLRNVFLKNIRLCPVVISIEFGNIVHLDIVPDAVSKACRVRYVDQTFNVERDLHAMSRRSVPVILSSRAFAYRLLMAQSTITLLEDMPHGAFNSLSVISSVDTRRSVQRFGKMKFPGTTKSPRYCGEVLRKPTVFEGIF